MKHHIKQLLTGKKQLVTSKKKRETSKKQLAQVVKYISVVGSGNYFLFCEIDRVLN